MRRVFLKIQSLVSFMKFKLENAFNTVTNDATKI